MAKQRNSTVQRLWRIGPVIVVLTVTACAATGVTRRPKREPPGRSPGTVVR